MKAYIFDFNGTMVKDSVLHETAWRRFVEQLCGRDVTDEEFDLHVHGKTSEMILRHFLGQQEITKEEIVKYSLEKEAYYRKLCIAQGEKFQLMDGLVDFLNKATEQGIPMTIATAANKENVDFYFEWFHLEQWFDKRLVVYDDATLKGKPDPDIYFRAMERIGAKPEDCVVFEDAVSGVLSAAAAGVRTIIGIYGDSNRRLLEETGKVDLYCEDFRDRILIDMN